MTSQQIQKYAELIVENYNKHILHDLVDKANNNIPHAQFELGAKLGMGKGVGENWNLSIELIIKSARQGYPPAMCMMGVMFALGQGVEQNYLAAHFCIRESIILGFPIHEFADQLSPVLLLIFKYT